MTGIPFSICCLMFLTILLIFYFSKKRLNTLDNKLFTILMITNIVGIIIDVSGFALFTMLGTDNKLNILISKIYLIYFLAYVFILFLYIYNVSTGKLQENISRFLTIFAIVSIVIFTLPINLYFEDSIGYSSGISVSITYLIGITMIITMLYYLIKNVKTIGYKKYTPLLAFVVLIILVVIIQNINPALTLMLFANTIVTYLMYFTIENPDMKLLEEVHKSKEISDTANEEKTMFLYNMTQEIRNTTNEINDSANEILDSSSLEDNKDSARNIIATTSKFTSMTNEILDVSQVDSENIKTYNSKYDIKNTLKQIVNIYNEECKKKTLEFRTNIDHDIPDSLYGDSISLKEALNKILKNSVNNTTNGYIELNVNTIIKNDICRLIITIEDSGNGIQSEELNTIKKDNKLLSEANSLIGVMQGTLIISSDYGLGTKVKVILDQKIVESENKEVIKYVSTLDNVNVLVCDTDSGLKVITKLLEGSNVKLDKVDNGKELLESIKENKYDVVLMDESTSTNNQILVSKMKSIRNFNSEIILLTRDNSYEYNDEYKNLGFDDYILKPLKKDILLEKINKYKDN